MTAWPHSGGTARFRSASAPGEAGPLTVIGDMRVPARRALGWLNREADRFAAAEDGDPTAESYQTALAELALFLRIVTRNPIPGAARPILARLTGALERAYRDPRLNGFIHTGPPEAAIGHVMIWLALDASGLAEPVMPRQHLVSALEARNIVAVPRSAMRFLELRLALDALGLRHDLPDRADFLAVSGLPGLLDSSNTADLYMATHWLFYLTDFGRYTLPGAGELIPSMRKRLADVATAGHWDLTAEFLLAGSCVHARPDATADAAWSALGAAQDPAGHMTGPPENRPPFIRAYHTCLVAAWAGLAETANRQTGAARHSTRLHE